MKPATLIVVALFALACAKETTGGSASASTDQTHTAPTPAAGKTAPAPTAPTATAPAAKGAEVAAMSGGAVIEDNDDYTLSVEAPAQLSVDQESDVAVTVTLKGHWHLNDEFPTRLKVNPPAGVEIDRPNQSRQDAVTYTDKVGKWAMKVKATDAGKKTVSGKLKFALCTDTTCNPRKTDLAFAFQAK